MKIHVYHHICLDKKGSAELDVISGKLSLIIRNQEKIMATLDETLAAVTAEDTKVDSIIALLTGIKAQLDAVLAGGLTPEVQAKVDAIFAQATGSAAKIDTAIAANTPPA